MSIAIDVSKPLFAHIKTAAEYRVPGIAFCIHRHRNGRDLRFAAAPVDLAPRFATYRGCQAAHKMVQILIVDDSTPIRKCIRTFIEQKTDWKVCGEADNGQVAVEKVKDLNPDLVVLDMSMPVMNGLEAARLIKKTSPRLPLVMFTMYVSDQLSKAAEAVGIKDVLSKEVGLEELIVSMRVALAS
jgi:CheY-like chemotaxis protein